MKNPKLLVAILMAIPAYGCSPDSVEEYQPSPEARAYASKLCSARHECRCADERFSSYSGCFDAIAKSFDAQVEAGAKVDKACLDEMLASEALNGCPPWVWDEQLLGSCAVLHKSKQLGEACSPPHDLAPLRTEECDSGLACLRGECRPLEEAEQPPTKIPSPGDPCSDFSVCFGMYCGYDHRCHTPAALGDPCDHPQGCEASAYCEGLGGANTGVCALRKQPGEACDPRDWVACASPDFPEQVNACDPASNTCAPDQPGICRLTHALIARQ